MISSQNSTLSTKNDLKLLYRRDISSFYPVKISSAKNRPGLSRSSEDIRSQYLKQLGIQQTHTHKTMSNRPTCVGQNFRTTENLKGNSATRTIRQMLSIFLNTKKKIHSMFKQHYEKSSSNPIKQVSLIFHHKGPDKKSEQAMIQEKLHQTQQQHQNFEPRKLRVQFADKVEVIFIPSHTEYSNRVKQQYWSNSNEIVEMACRNFVEFEAEGYSYENVLEEQEMIFCQETREFIHPIHFGLFPRQIETRNIKNKALDVHD